MAVAPLNVVVCNVGDECDATYETQVGPYGRKYDLSFVCLMSLIRGRQGYQQKKLEHKPNV